MGRSRSSHHPSESTLSGSVVPFSPPSLPSSKCGSQSKSTTRVDLPLSTASASKRSTVNLCVHHELHEYDQDEEDSSRAISRVPVLQRVYIPKSSGSGRAIGWSLSENG